MEMFLSKRTFVRSRTNVRQEGLVLSQSLKVWPTWLCSLPPLLKVQGDCKYKTQQKIDIIVHNSTFYLVISQDKIQPEKSNSIGGILNGALKGDENRAEQ